MTDDTIALPKPSLLIPIVVACSFFMEQLDSTIITTAIPAMANSLHVEPVRLSLAITSYILSLAVFIPISGWFADRYGSRRVFCSAIVIFTLGSALSGFATSLWMLVITRILLQFFLQHVGVMLLRAQRPELERPFRMPLYPAPPLVAMAGFTFVLVNRSQAMQGLAVATGIALSGTLIYLWRARQLAEWPFARK